MEDYENRIDWNWVCQQVGVAFLPVRKLVSDVLMASSCTPAVALTTVASL